MHHESPWVKRCLSQKSESTLLVEGSIPSGLVSQTQGGHDEYQEIAAKCSVRRCDLRGDFTSHSLNLFVICEGGGCEQSPGD
ncbi:MAG: hypothetical protein ACK5TC_03755 [bacterium]